MLRDSVREEARREGLARELREWVVGDVADQVAERLGVLRAMRKRSGGRISPHL
ncbi:hypothetical protein [Nonomuraea recticatena]|uniref:Uncharacterized protein n=1 Tax=Nonomuraea recticatena TaxID=46178 RepID=A0ABP6FLH9_9ACTN